MSVKPVLSVIVPACNTEAFVGITLRSIQKQSFQDWECIVVDDASTDGTIESAMQVIGSDTRFRLVRHSSRRGVSAARNRGFCERSPSSDFICFMDSDDCWNPDALGSLLESLRSNPSAVGAHGIGEYIDGHGGSFFPGAFEHFGRKRLGYYNGSIRVWPQDEPSCFSTLCWAGTVYPPGLLVAHRWAYERVGLFDEHMRYCEDWDMVIRLSRLGELAFINRSLIQYRRHLGNATHNHSANIRGARRVHIKTFFSQENTAAHRTILREGWKAWERYKLQEKCDLALRAMRDWDLGGFSKNVCAAPLHALRYLSGYPEVSIL